MKNIVCTDPRHDLRQGLPGWTTKLGETSRGITPDGYVCDACALMRPLEATAQVNHPASHVILLGDGGFIVQVALVYEDGSVVGFRPMRIGKVLDKWTAAERTTAAALVAKLRS